MRAQQLITEHIDLWTSTIKAKKNQGRGSNKKRELYGIKKLRELILELAVRGKLVPQDPNDEPASVLLERIAAEKVQLIKDKKIKKQKPLPKIADEEKLFDLPDGWEWSRLGDLCDTKTGYAFKSRQYVDEGTFVLRVTNIESNGKIIKADNKYIDSLSANGEFNKFLLNPDDILLVMVGGSLGKIGVVSINDLPAVLNQNMWRFVRFGGVEKNYFIHGLKLINSSQITITKSTHGHLSQGDYLRKLFPLPPEKEQHRIVAKVDELMALCGQLEQQTESSLDAHKRLVDTLLSTLTDARNANELSSNWARLADHFGTLITTDYAVEQLKQTILQLAVMGKLVPQDPNDEPASELLKRITAEKEQLIKDKKIKKQKPLPEIADKERIFELPDSWQWYRMDDFCFGITSGSTPPKSEFNDHTGVPYLKVYNIRDQFIDFEYRPQFVTPDYHSTKLKRSVLYPGDVIMNIVGPPLGKVAIIPDTYPEWNCNQAITFFRPIEKEFNSYIYTYIKAGIFLKSIDLIGTAGQDNISVTKSRSIAIPVPPLEEQQRIVTKVDELMALCDQLKAQLNNAQTSQLHLSDAVVENALTA
ncbi:MAG: type I restriction enzyme S subunit [Cycloclasticus pugetii]|jgi:type I restriction enzyme S subunit|uniref:restriction endonuclease subunit S n=1 Tax=Cycloclasticus pugetii TaxID=34068 RepID=UPI0039E6CCAE